jgi:hypothetical protein
MWGVAHDGSVLWHWEGSTGHFPAIADVDNDGRDEVFVGFALLDHDGKVVFERDSGVAHQDASYIIQLPDGTWRLLFGNGGINCLAPDGSELWHHPLSEAQHVVAGRFRPDLGPIQFMVIDRGQPVADGKRAPAKLYLYDLDGREIWLREQPEGSWVSAIVEIDWSGKGYPQEVLVYNRGQGNPATIYDGSGNIVDTVEMRYLSENMPEDQKTYYCTRADVWGDSRQEVIFFGPRGACIYANSRIMAIPTLYNNTLYPGM